jgi:hypothetical protein
MLEGAMWCVQVSEVVARTFSDTNISEAVVVTAALHLCEIQKKQGLIP